MTFSPSLGGENLASKGHTKCFSNFKTAFVMFAFVMFSKL